MQVADHFEVEASRERTFALLHDVRLMAPCIPGCKDLRETANGEYAAVMEVAVAFLKLRFDVRVQIVETEAPVRVKARLTGKPKGLIGQLAIDAEVVLSEVAPERTDLAYAVDASLTGRLGSVGQSVYRAKAEEMGGAFAANLRRLIEESKTEVPA
jgi:carbon monoxide dehydrogenase subunit G